MTLVLLPSTAEAQRTSSSETTETSEEEEPDELPGPDYLRAFLWNTAFLAGGTIWYWIDERNIVDWDLDSWEQRFDESSYRFDNNEFPINYIGHPLSGGAYYGLPRANRLMAWESFLYAVATSFVWEFFLEFFERFSLNDFVATPLGGVPIGEGFIRLGRWLDNSAHPALAWTFGLPVAIHELLDGRQVGVENPGDADEDPGWARVTIDAGFAWALPQLDRDAPGFDVTRVGASSEFVALDGYLEPGERLDGFFDAEVVRLRMDALFGSEGAGFELEADTIVAGMHASSLQDRGGGRMFGTSAIVGTSISHFFRFENFDPWHERLSYTGFPGLAVQVEEHLDEVVVAFDGRAQPLFGGSNAAYVLPRWQRANPSAVPKSLLTRHSYWNGWGYTMLGRFELRLGGTLTLAAQGRYLAIDSQEGYDRNEADVTQDADGYGELIETLVEARLDLAELFVVRARWFRQRRVSSLDQVRSRGRLDRFELALGFGFH